MTYKFKDNYIEKLKELGYQYIDGKYESDMSKLRCYDKEGDIVYVNYGYGYCGELSTGHYGIIMSDIVNNMYFVVTLSSDPLNDYEYYLEGLNLPNAEGDKNKKSYVRFEQSRFMHFRRLTNISVNGLQIYRKLTPEQVKDVKKHFSQFMKLSIDKEEK